MKKRPSILICSTSTIHLDLLASLTKEAVSNFYIDRADSCDDALYKIGGEFNYDAYIFDGDECHFIDAVINNAKNKSYVKRIVFENLRDRPNSDEKLSRINHISSNNYYISIDNQIVTSPGKIPADQVVERRSKICGLLSFILEPPTFYFTYANKKSHNKDIENSKDITIAIDEYIRRFFPNLRIKVDYNDFRKGDLHEKYFDELTGSDYLIVIFSDEYFLSRYAMDEFNVVLEKANYNINSFKKNMIFIYSNSIHDKLNPDKTELHQCFKKEFVDHWRQELEKYTNAYLYENEFSTEYQKRLLSTTNFLSHCYKVIKDDLHKVITGEKLQLSDLRGVGCADLVFEIDTKLKSSGHVTFYDYCEEGSGSEIFYRKSAEITEELNKLKNM